MKRLLTASLLALGISSATMAVTYTGDLIAIQKANPQLGMTTQNMSYQSVITGLGAQVKKTLADGRIVVVRPPRGKSWQQHRQTLLESGLFSSVEPDTLAMPTATPDDPNLNSQWHLFQISAPRAWDFKVGTAAPIVAIVDGGVDTTHPDLAPNLVPGYNTITGLAQNAGGVVLDGTTAGHGTRCAGIAAARGNNGLGVSGVGWNLRIMPIRATDSPTGVTPRSELLEGVQWAVDNGGKGLSVGFTEVEFAHVHVMGAYARAQGALLVWGAGNSGNNWSSFDHTKVTVVGGTDQNDARWVFGLQSSGYGRAVDLYAPCTQIYTIKKGGGYGNAPGGVSFAVPQVAATLALMMEAIPTASADLIEQLLLWRTFDLGVPGRDEAFGWGRLNAGKAVENPARRYELHLLPRPIGSTWATATVINDHEDIFGIAGFPDGSQRLLQWQGVAPIRSIAAPAGPIGAASVAIYDVNSSARVVGQSYGTGFVLDGSDGNVQTFGPAVYEVTRPRAINDSGDMVGYDDQLGVATQAWIWFAGEPERTFPVSGGIALDITNRREVYGTQGPSGSDPFMINALGNLQVLPRSFGNSCRIYKSNNSGLAAGFQFNAPGLNNLQSVMWDNFAQSDRVLGLGQGTFPVGAEARSMNDFNEVVGSVDAYNGASVLQSVSIGKLQDLLTSPSAEFANLAHTGSINNKGQIVGWGTSSGGTQNGFLANPVDTPYVGVGIGQLGAGPTYIGSIPPTLSVTFTDADGVEIPNSTVLPEYQGAIGRLALDPPPSVTSNFRLYLRCNGTAIPGFIGPTYLNLLYPPLEEPAIPRDAYYVPYDGPSLGGDAPLILLYSGDCDGSGEIDAADIDAVIADFGLVGGDPGWDGTTDSDGSGEVDASEIDHVIANFGLVGDPEP